MAQASSGQDADLATPAGRLAAAARIPAPGYDRSALRTGIAHIGVGAFHRAHQAMYLDRLLSQADAREQAMSWGIRGVDVLAADLPKREKFAVQDGCYTLVLKHPDGSTQPRLIGSLTGYLHAPSDPGKVADLL